MKVKNALTALAIAMSATTASAATVVDTDFTVIADDGLGGFVEIGTGTASYDRELVPMLGFFSLGPTDAVADAADPNLALSMTVDTGGGPVTLTDEDDSDFDAFPVFEFFSGMLGFIDFQVVNGENGVNLLGLPQGSEFALVDGFIDLIADPNDPNAEIEALFLIAEGSVGDVAPIPLPAGGVLLLSALGLGAYASRKRAS